MISDGLCQRYTCVELADIFKNYGYEFGRQYKLPESYTSIMNLILNCRTAALGKHVERCDSCGYNNISYNSCRNRHCPKCQYRAREKWIEARESELLPVSYYHIVFTIPGLLNRLVLINKRTLYNILFKSASETLLSLGRDPKHLGGDIGIIAVLHTWGQTLMDHPHLHCIVPGGGLSEDGKKWKSSKKSKFNQFFIHVNVISDLFKKKFLRYLKKAYSNNELQFCDSIASLQYRNSFKNFLNKLYEKKWVTYCKHPFHGAKQVIEYLGGYTHRVAISNNRIKRIEEGKVVFDYKDYRDSKRKEMRLSPVEFIRRFMFHILPEGFFKIRYYGILSSRKKKVTLKICIGILTRSTNNQPVDGTTTPKTREWVCPKCNTGNMIAYPIIYCKAPG